MKKSINLDNVAIAISSFRSTKSIDILLEKIFSSNIIFSEVIVVDSLSDGSLEKLIERKKYNVTFYNASTNIGSAGNLNKRLEIASSNPNNKWCFCINHDGYFSAESILNLFESVETIKEECINIGAIFPERVYYHKKQSLLARNKSTYSEVLWDSSDGCLYSLEPYRLGCRVNDELWMGWEDLLYCLQLREKGYRCFISHNSFYYDSYEYQKLKFLFLSFYIADKPSWYNYYSIRNLVLGLKYLESKDYLRKKIAITFFKSIILTIAFKKNKVERLDLSFKGLVDGIRNKTGYKE